MVWTTTIGAKRPEFTSNLDLYFLTPLQIIGSDPSAFASSSLTTQTNPAQSKLNKHVL